MPLPVDEFPRIHPRTHLPAPPGPPSPLTLAKGAAIELFAIDQQRWTGKTASLKTCCGRTLLSTTRWAGASVARPGGRSQERGGSALRRRRRPRAAAYRSRAGRQPGSRSSPGPDRGALDRVGELRRHRGRGGLRRGGVGVLRLEERESPRLDLLLFPRVLDGEGRAHAAPLQAAGGPGRRRLAPSLAGCG